MRTGHPSARTRQNTPERQNKTDVLPLRERSKCKERGVRPRRKAATEPNEKQKEKAEVGKKRARRDSTEDVAEGGVPDVNGVCAPQPRATDHC